MFYELENVYVAGYADDNTPYVQGENIDSLVSQLELISVKLFHWFDINGMKANPDKCHLLLSTQDTHSAYVANHEIQNSHYCSLVWMSHSRKLNNKINRIQERALRMIYNDRTSSFDELLNKNGSVTVHVQNIRSLMIEMFKAKIGEGPEILSDIFERNNNPTYNLRCNNDFKSRKIKTEQYGSA